MNSESSIAKQHMSSRLKLDPTHVPILPVKDDINIIFNGGIYDHGCVVSVVLRLDGPEAHSDIRIYYVLCLYSQVIEANIGPNYIRKTFSLS